MSTRSPKRHKPDEPEDGLLGVSYLDGGAAACSTEAEDSEHSPSAADMDAEIDDDEELVDDDDDDDYNYQSDSGTEDAGARDESPAPSPPRPRRAQSSNSQADEALAGAGERAQWERARVESVAEMAGVTRFVAHVLLEARRWIESDAIDLWFAADSGVRAAQDELYSKGVRRDPAAAPGDAAMGGGTCCVCYDELDKAAGEGDGLLGA